MPNQGATAQRLQGWAGTYTTDLPGWGAYFSPLIIDADGQTATLAGADLSLTLDPATGRLAFDWTPIQSTRAKGFIEFSYSNQLDRAVVTGEIMPRPQDGPLAMSGAITDPTLPPAQADPIFQTVAQSVANAIANGARSPTNPVLEQMSSDPLAVLQAHGMPRNAFDGAHPDVRSAYVEYLKQMATSEMEMSQNGLVPRTYHWGACWACRIGFGAIVVALGTAISLVTLGTGTPAYAALLAALTRVVGAVLATSIMAGGGTAIGGGAVDLIEYICESIPNTCA